MYMKDKIILITGPKHSGKTLTARALQKILGGEVIDLDEIMEKQVGKTPRMLYRDGPEFFQMAETLALASLIGQKEPDDKARNKKCRIIAAGGGLIDNKDALELLSKNQEILIIYLEVSAETAWQRIQNSAVAEGELPPFLNTENPRSTLFALHERRAKAYKILAHHTIAAENKSPEEIAKKIAELYSQQGNL